jgi:hypothetical protein
MQQVKRWRVVVLASVVTGASSLGLLTGLASPGAAATSHASPSCRLVTDAMIQSTLHLSAGPAKSTSPFTGEVKCTYKVGSNSLAVQVTFLTESLSTFSQIEKGFTSGGAKVISGIGQAAYAPSLHSTGMSYTDLYFYAKGTDVAIGAQVSINQVEVLAKQVIAKL